MIEKSLPLPQSTPSLDLVPSAKLLKDKFICDICEREFANLTSVNEHMNTHINSDPEVPFRCDVCGKCFAVAARLTRHYRTHTGEKPYNCNTCNKSFSVKENLNVHERTHTQEKPYQCTVCQRSFEHSGKLHRHMRIHTGERPHQCNICKKTFIQSGQLVIHMRTHTGEKPYVCKTCEKGFTCSKQLKVHMRTHTGEKPYSCDICGKSFGYNHVLKLHQMAHFAEKVYKCTICKTTFSTKKHLEAHIKTHDESYVDSQRPYLSPLRPASLETSTSTSEEDFSMFRASSSPLNRLPTSNFLHLNAPVAHSSMISHAIAKDTMNAQFLLPSINTICPGDATSMDITEIKKNVDQAAAPQKPAAPRASLIRRNPVYPITPTLVKTLLEEDLETYGPPTPLRTPSLSPEIYGGCLIKTQITQSPLTPPPSVSPPTISMMTESSLPLRKRRLALSECSDSDDLSSKPEPALTNKFSRSSVICFATRA